LVKRDKNVSSMKNKLNDINVKITRAKIINKNIFIFRNIFFSCFISSIESIIVNRIKEKRKNGKKKILVSKIIFFSPSWG